MKKIIKDYVIITLGVFIAAFGLAFFLIPSELAVGGVTGLAMVINKILPSISLGSLMFIMNIILFIVGFLLIGRQFGFKTIYASFSLTGFISLLQTIYPIENPLVEDIFLNLIVGIIIQGIGMAMIFYKDASTGGTDIIAKILNKYFHIEIAKALFLSDFIITLFAGFIFGIELGLYALLGVLINCCVIDNVIEKLDLKMSISIVSSNPYEIKKFINEDLDRGATIYEVKGAYTDKDKTMITSVMSKRELNRLKIFVKDTDQNAFIIVSNVKEVLGNGFNLPM